MNRDKAKDLVKMVLPSRAAKMARDRSREIHRQERHAVKTGLRTMDPDDEWEDGVHFSSIDRAEVWAASEMPRRVQDRRGADNLGGLKQWTKAIQKKSDGDDVVAYEKAAQVLQPGKSIITKHAMEHVGVWLDAPQARFFRPDMNERDLLAAQVKIREGLRKYYGDVLLTEAELKAVLYRLFSEQHHRINKILKKYNLVTRSCTDQDPCTVKTSRPTQHYFIYDAASWKKWKRCSISEYSQAMATGQKARTSRVMEEEKTHNIQKCPNRVLLRGPSDVETLHHKLCSMHLRHRPDDKAPVYNYYLMGIDNVKNALLDILKLAGWEGVR